MKPIKQLASRHLPYPLVKLAKQAIHFGNHYHCPVCGSSVRKLLSSGHQFEVLSELDVVGGGWRPQDRCPVCHANDRIRLLFYYLKEEMGVFGKKGRLLHFAPERALDEKFTAVPGIDYVPSDIDARRYRHLRNFRECDVVSLPFKDHEFDWIICCHVLEHVPDDRQALRELYRVLRPNGVAILQVPIARKLGHTLEDPSATSRESRIRRFGQEDHVRLYAADFVTRLASAGFIVEVYSGGDVTAEVAMAWHMNPREQLFICKKPAAS
jgi:SAM-dependent methyltransferase